MRSCLRLEGVGPTFANARDEQRRSTNLAPAHSEFVTDLAAREGREAEDQGHAPS